MIFRSVTIIVSVLLLALPASVWPQAKRKAPVAPSQQEQIELAENLIKATQEYKTSLDNLRVYYENDLKAATENFNKRASLLEQGIISKHDLSVAEQAVNSAKEKLADLDKKVSEADGMLEEAEAAEQLAKSPRDLTNKYSVSEALIRYNGSANWVISDAVKVEHFFTAKFGHELPISAYGQTAVHDRLGFDHRNAIDVAVNPESAEGQALMDYLRSAGIPFLAFRHAVAGAATGAHIHIGRPSSRLAIHPPNS